MGKIKILLGIYLFSIIALFFYSYTQVDLSLTLSRASIFQSVEKSFQYVGYFDRPLSAEAYIAILFILFTTSFLLLKFVRQKKISEKTIWIVFLFTAGLLTFAYNAFSYDLFNYIFDAKIVTFYHLDPYLYKALDFPHDPMLSFMHWTQRTYPYGPFWLFVTVPLSFVGFQFFLPTFFLFKLLVSSSVVGTGYFIKKIMEKIDRENAVFALAVFATSPLVIIEGLVSAHNDMVMIFLATLALYLLIINKYVRSFLLLFVSIATKYATIMLLPLFSAIWLMEKQKRKINWGLFIVLSALFMVVPIIAASMRTNFQPWYFLYVLPFVPLVGKKYYVLIPYVTFSFFALLEYVPFLYTGNWNTPIPALLNGLSILGIFCSLVITGIWFLRNFLVAKKVSASIQ